MTPQDDDDHDTLVERLTNGFGALLEQVQELADKNQKLEQRLARIRQEVYHIFRDEGPLSAVEQEAGLNPKKKGYYGGLVDGQVSAPTNDQPVFKGSEEMGTKDKSSARAIAGAVQAWKILTHRRVPNTVEPTKELGDRRWRPPPVILEEHEKTLPTPTQSELKTEQESSTEMSPSRSRGAHESQACPFPSPTNPLPSDHPKLKDRSGDTQRPDSVITPPDLHDEPLQNIAKGQAKQGHTSAPPSVEGSVSKCPIRFLDHHSPEEVAEYFKDHKHEIPRSHEICVKRYQSNEASIRQLDAKYGNLVSMIQGLGVKHQPLLPTKDSKPDSKPDPEHKPSQHSHTKIEKWAEAVGEVPQSQAIAGLGTAAEQNAQADKKDKEAQDASEAHKAPQPRGRESHCEKPLKEVRVGESLAGRGESVSPLRRWSSRLPMWRARI